MCGGFHLKKRLLRSDNYLEIYLEEHVSSGEDGELLRPRLCDGAPLLCYDREAPGQGRDRFSEKLVIYIRIFLVILYFDHQRDQQVKAIM